MLDNEEPAPLTRSITGALLFFAVLLSAFGSALEVRADGRLKLMFSHSAAR
jgi:hypothetical protein